MSRITRRALLARAATVAFGAAGLLAGCSASPSQPAPAAATAAPTTQPAASRALASRPVSAAATSVASAPVATSPATAAVPAAVPTVSPVATATASGGPLAHVAVVQGDKPAAITRKAIEALGGIGQFVKPGQRVLIKPNICVAQAPEYAATTNPEVVGAIVALCKEAGAARVLVVDYPFGANTAYRISGIEAAVKAAGGEIEPVSRLKFKKVALPEGKDIKSWAVYEDALTADVVINVPIAKDHNLATLTLGMKNLLGIVDDRGAFHSNIGQRLADLTSLIRPELTVIDAVRILLRNGPTGGNLRDVKQTNTIIASADPVAADAYATTLFGMTGNDIAYVRAAAAMGLGNMDLASLRLAELRL
ncbi:MAG: DUF362 domain-containing protein [Chloroflexota bacterium]